MAYTVGSVVLIVALKIRVSMQQELLTWKGTCPPEMVAATFWGFAGSDCISDYSIVERATF